MSNVPTTRNPISKRVHIVKPSTSAANGNARSLCGAVETPEWNLRRLEKVNCKSCLKTHENGGIHV